MDDITYVCKKPKRSELKPIVATIIKKYPVLRAIIHGTILGDGTSTLLAKLEARRENMDRLTPKQKKPTNDCTSSAAKKQKVEKNEYGCIVANYHPLLPDGETEDTQEEKRSQLETMYSEDFENAKIDEEMMATYSSQRKMITEGEPLTAVLDSWPFLGEERWLLKHFQHLTGVTILGEAVAQKALQIYTYLVAQPKQSTLMKEVFSTIAIGRRAVNNKKPIVNAVLHVLAAHFKEEASTIVRCYKVTINFLLN